ncbi:MAG TPA: TVP38/TMEM64 family protein [Stellaceae bacterium]|nr:TVP38/TMEM64 family protein [Stellaceae bacterium]
MADEVPRPVAAPRFVPLGILVVGGALFLALGGHRYLSLAALAEHREWLTAVVARAGVTAALTFILGYAALVALSVPGGAIFTITGGFLFGPWLGTAYAVIGATVGATVVFLAARAGFAGLVARAGPWVRRLESNFRKNGLNYLLVLRLIPIFPFWLVNLIAGAVGLQLWVYVLGTFFGIIPVTFIYASLGNGLGTLAAEGRPPDLSVLFRPSVILPILGLAALALLPVILKRWRVGAGAA